MFILLYLIKKINKKHTQNANKARILRVLILEILVQIIRCGLIHIEV
jgi:predicted DNA-binding ribbon-helix-helix protein